MESAHRTYLATQIFSEQATVSYRSAARALKLHVNAAKRTLYEFHAHENRRKPGSVHATYLLAGTRKPEEKPPAVSGHANGVKGDEEPIPSSPPPFTSSMLESSQPGENTQQVEHEIVPVKNILLVREEALQAAQEQFEVITSVHIYSLASYPLQDLQALTDIGRNLFTSVFVREDPLIHNKTYGVIQNAGVRRRTARRPPISEAPAPKFKAVKDEPKQASTASKPASQLPTLKREDSSRPSSVASTISTSSTKKPSLRRDTSDIFKSFSKVKSKPTLERKGTDTSNAESPTPSGAEDAKMTDADEEGESEDEALFLDTGTRKPGKKRSSEDGDMKQDKQDRAAKLRKMMDSDEEELQERPERGKVDQAGPSDQEQGGNEEDKSVAWSDSDTERSKAVPMTENSAENTPTEPSTTGAETKRRRGRRKVMKKRIMKDEEGYLVTKEEAVWESFSEDEPTRQPKPTPTFQAMSQSQVRSSKGSVSSIGSLKASTQGACKGGNIMSFFGKK